MMNEAHTAGKNFANGTKRAAIAGMVVAALCSGGLAHASDVQQTQQGVSPSALEQLVNRFEDVTPFRGDGKHLPADADQGFQLGSVAFYPAETDDVAVEMSGFTNYGLTEAGYGLIAAGNGPGNDRVGFVINDRAMDSFAIDIGLPSDAVVHNNSETGEVEVLGNDSLTTIAPATAVDSAGRVLLSRYEIVGDQLEVSVDLDNAVLPVLVDPVVDNQWWGHTDYYSRSDVRSYAAAYQVLDVAKRGCNVVGNVVARSVCKATVGRYTGWIADTWQHAKNTNQCLSMSITWTGTVTGVRAYPCNWG